jgi:ribonucleoside-diphosphate reductase alpha chain
MQIWDAMCGTILSTGARRGAMMATLRCDHPDVEEFVTAKQQRGQLRRFNLSVQVTDALIAAVRSDDRWPLMFPARAFDGDGETIWRGWPGEDRPVPCRVTRRVGARQLWERILRATYDYAEPGVLFIDRINHLNNLWYRERLTATNPCGEIPLPPYGACDLGSLNLTRFVHSPFTPAARIDFQSLEQTTRCAVRLLDNVIDASRVTLPASAAGGECSWLAARRPGDYRPCRRDGHDRTDLRQRRFADHGRRYHAAHLPYRLSRLHCAGKGERLFSLLRTGPLFERRFYPQPSR